MLDSPEVPIPEFDHVELDRLLDRAKVRSAGMRARRRRHRLMAAGTLTAVTLVLAGTLIGLQFPGRSRLAPQTAPHHLVSPAWRLVGDVSPAWRTLTGSGYQPGFVLACPATTTCYAQAIAQPGTLHRIEVTRDGGRDWQQSTLPVPLSDPTPLACVDAATCTILGIDASGHATFLETTDGGMTWSASPGPGQLTSRIGVTALTCATSTSCVAIASDPEGPSGDTLAFVTTDGGATWTTSNLPSGFVTRGLHCSPAGTCVAAGFSRASDGGSATPPGTILHSTDGGTTWNTAATPSGLGPLTSLSCGGTSDCLASFYGDDGSSGRMLTSTDGGRSWSAAAAFGLPDGLVDGLSCPTGSQCWAAGTSSATGGSGGSGPKPVAVADANGLVASTSDGGQSWQTAQLPPGVGAVVAISCPSDSNCYALALQRPASGPGSIALLVDGDQPATT